MTSRAESAVEAWVQHYDHNGGLSRDEGVKVALDPAGNAIVAGNADVGNNGSTIVVLKYSNAGLPMWTNSYSSGDLSSNTVSALAVDGSGDILITGTSDLNGATTIKYSTAGVALWTNYYQGSADIAHALALTTNNDVVVTGQSIGDEGNYNQFVIQYSSVGTPMWTNRYNGPTNGDDSGRAVVIDGAGNILVTGGSVGSSGGWDWLTIKYASSGTPVWTNRYDSGSLSLNQNNFAKAIATVANGDVIVAGRTYLTGLEIIRYSGDGTSLHTNIVGGNFHAAYYVKADQNGDVVFAGRTSNGIGGFGVRKYSGAGALLWATGYGAAYLGEVVVDGGNNIIVTGENYGGVPGNYIFTVKFSSAGEVVSTNRYYAAGGQSGHSVAVDDDGNFFVAGFSDETGAGVSGHDFILIKYVGPANPPAIIVPPQSRTNIVGDSIAFAATITGTLPLHYQWWKDGSPILDATNLTHDITDIQTNDAGNYFVVVTNHYGSVTSAVAILSVVTSPLILSHPQTSTNLVGSTVGFAVGAIGAEPLQYQWWKAGAPIADETNETFGIANLLSSDAGDYFVVVTNDYGSVTSQLASLTVNLPPQLIESWVQRYNGSGDGVEIPQAVAVDEIGNVFVTGYTSGTNWSNFDFLTIAYSSTGVPLWTNRYDGPGSQEDIAYDIAVDGSGNVFVAGYSAQNGSGNDFVTVAYSGAGVALWTNRYDGPANNSDQARAIAVDTNGNVYVTGYSWTGSALVYVTIAYSNNGAGLWTNLYGSGGAQPAAIAVSGTGNVYVTGYAGGSAVASDYATVAYSSAGLPLWTNRYNGPSNGSDQANALAVDASGNVYVTGKSYDNTTTSWRYATVAYSDVGEELWVNRYGGIEAKAVAVGGNGNIYVTGNSPNGVNGDYLTIGYGPDGEALSENRFDGNGTMNGHDDASAVAVDGSGNMYVTGSSDGNGTAYDFATIIYSADGQQVLASNRYNGSVNGPDMPLTLRSMALAPDGVVVIGQSDNEPDPGITRFGYAVVKYVLTPPSNQPPVSAGFGAVTFQDQTLSLTVSNLLAVISDPEGGAISLVSVAAASTNGAAITQTNDIITYTPVAGFVGPDRFNYVVADNQGATNAVAAQIAVLPVGTVVQSFSAPSVTPGQVSFDFTGNPGEIWTIERAAELSGPWTNVATILIQPDGTATYQDSDPPTESGYYRATKP